MNGWIRPLVAITLFSTEFAFRYPSESSEASNITTLRLSRKERATLQLRQIRRQVEWY